jgi:hypothetical protein
MRPKYVWREVGLGEVCFYDMIEDGYRPVGEYFPTIVVDEKGEFLSWITRVEPNPWINPEELSFEVLEYCRFVS